MKLQDNTILSFLNVTAGKDPVPGGGSVSALCGSLAAALAEMVTGLTIGRKKYVEAEPLMLDLAPKFVEARQFFLNAIDEDAEAYNVVFNAFKLPKETDEDKAFRSQKIQEATLIAALVPFNVASKAVEMMPLIRQVADNGNQNAITDCCVAMMCARTAALGAILNVRINLTSLKDQDKVAEFTKECNRLENEARHFENDLLENVKI